MYFNLSIFFNFSTLEKECFQNEKSVKYVSFSIRNKAKFLYQKLWKKHVQ